ncbi:Valine--tRNA ligase [Symmachiella dynata]|uniref:Valine--tRNA ligase n=1 Tax=Symmachiella dynata TaxID=2527995 RepID=A0A517ZXA7_9PLAN|nr:valine--tRNA ligase [Symmachiella dynata]QDU47123.1 Valine--tRNA ligase [Symmachiella dynata]
MTTELPKQYEPKAAQERWYSQWEQDGRFDADPDPEKPSHTIMIPLPNVTGALHMGHALNGTLQDLITRWRRMQGFEALWMPGTDHAGIATQSVVERRMFEEEGLTRHDIGREALVERIWTWKDQYEARILNQLKQMGASCDWRRTRFTLDDMCSVAVRKTFFKLFRDELIFRGKRLVNWDTFLQTAVANDEVFHETVPGHFWTFTYPVVGSDETLAFSTTRPETMLGDSAIAVHPSDERYAHLIGKMVSISVTGREIPIIADGILVDKELGTGAVKVTPAHDHNDYACGQRNDLPVINILNNDGTINENGAPYEGLDRYEARKKIVADMEAAGHLVKIEDRDIEIAHSDRSKTPIEPYLSDQWFVAMQDLAQSAIDAVEDGRVRFYPARYTKTYNDWLGEKRDWCISRQLWWGHQIPIWYCDTCSEADLQAAFGEREDVSYRRDADDTTWLICGETDLAEDAMGAEHKLVRDPDVLDTWFSSALWPHATLGWPEQTKDLDYFYPGNVLITSRDIITLWVARMVIMGLYNMGDIPFAHVHIHPKILDSFGQTMSKSKGNGVNPLDIIDKYGTDAMRFTIASFAGESQDVKIPVDYECPHCGGLIPQTLKDQKATPDGGEKPRVTCKQCKKSSQFSSPWFDPDEGEPVARIVSERFEYGRNFCNKLWNAARFAMLNLEGYTPGEIAQDELQVEDRWILSRLSRTAESINALLSEYKFDAATRALRDFVWNEFCDWYVEMVKPRLRDEEAKPSTQRILVGVLDGIVRLLAPFTPFLTEELWARLNEIAPQRGLFTPQPAAESCMIASYPEFPLDWQDAGLESRFARLQETIVAVRNLRAVYRIANAVELQLHVRCPAGVAAELDDVAPQFDNLAKTKLAATGPDIEPPPASASFSLTDADGFVPLEGIVDLGAELERQKAEAEKLRGHIGGHEKKLANKNFVDRAPAEVVEDVRETLAGLKKQLESIETIVAQLGGS